MDLCLSFEKMVLEVKCVMGENGWFEVGNLKNRQIMDLRGCEYLLGEAHWSLRAWAHAHPHECDTHGRVENRHVARRLDSMKQI